MALPAVSAPSSEVVENQNVARIRPRVPLTGSADQPWTNAKRRCERMDYASYVAQDALRCLTKYPTQILTAR